MSEEPGTYSAKREVLVQRFDGPLAAEQVTTVSFALVPWLDEVPATFAFFEELREVHASAMLTPDDDPSDLWDRAYVAVNQYRETAVRHGASGYVAAAEAALAGADPDSVAPSQLDVVSLDRELPAHLTLKVGAEVLQLEAMASKKGNLWYSVADDAGRPARSGVAVPPSGDELPATVELGGSPMPLGPAPLWDREQRSYRDDEYEPFDLKRLVEREVLLADRRFEARVVVSVRKSGQWNVTARVVPQESVPASAVGKASTTTRRAPNGASREAEYGPGGRELSPRESELMEALRDQ